MDDLLVMGSSRRLDVIIAKLSETFTNKSPGGPIFHLKCNYKTETLTGDTRVTTSKTKLKHNDNNVYPLQEPEVYKGSKHPRGRKKTGS